MKLESFNDTQKFILQSYIDSAFVKDCGRLLPSRVLVIALVNKFGEEGIRRTELNKFLGIDIMAMGSYLANFTGRHGLFVTHKEAKTPMVIRITEKGQKLINETYPYLDKKSVSEIMVMIRNWKEFNGPKEVTGLQVSILCAVALGFTKTSCIFEAVGVSKLTARMNHCMRDSDLITQVLEEPRTFGADYKVTKRGRKVLEILLG